MSRQLLATVGLALALKPAGNVALKPGHPFCKGSPGVWSFFQGGGVMHTYGLVCVARAMRFLLCLAEDVSLPPGPTVRLRLRLPRLMLFALEIIVSIAADNPADCCVIHLAVSFFSSFLNYLCKQF